MLLSPIQEQIIQAMRKLKLARLEGDKLTIQLAEAALNNLLEQFSEAQK